MHIIVVTLFVVLGVCQVNGRYSGGTETCSPTKMKALRSVYETNAKVLALKGDLESELLDLVLSSPDVCEEAADTRHTLTAVRAERPVPDDSALRDQRLENYRLRLDDLMTSLKTGRVTVPTVENINTTLLKNAAVKLPTEVSQFTIDRYLSVLKQINASDDLLEAWFDHISMDRTDPRVTEQGRQGLLAAAAPLTLNCDLKARSDSRPTSVHKLRPGDIDVIGAMGDSLTAGFGADATFLFVWQWFYEYRGQSWSGGGDESFGQGYTTLPNILKEFNPNLKGYSEGVVKLTEDPLKSAKTMMNVAITGDVASDMTAQARNLVEKLNNDPSIDVKNDWKMVTLFIGANNLCAFCEDEVEHSAESYIAEIQKGLDILKTNIPRVYVNLVEIFDIVPLTEMADFEFGTIVCSAAHSLADVCQCTRDQSDLNYKFDAAALKARSDAYVKAINTLVDSGRYDDTDDFTVVVQPFFRHTGPPQTARGEPDMSYFAQDCFHFSSKGQNRAGIALWNSIIKPIGRKPTTWNIDDLADCPRVEYLPTKKNL